MNRISVPSTTKLDKNSDMGNIPKVNNQDTRGTSMTSLWCIYCKPKAHNTARPSATATDSEQANARWYVE